MVVLISCRDRILAHGGPLKQVSEREMEICSKCG